MYGKKVKLRALFLIALILSLTLIVFLVLNSLKENVVYFLSPTEIKTLNEVKKDKIRVGGMVKKSSINIINDEIIFIITDFQNEINVTYSGLVPNLFQENKGVVAEGFLKDKNYFKATKILAKHDENYMPPDLNKKKRRVEIDFKLYRQLFNYYLTYFINIYIFKNFFGIEKFKSIFKYKSQTINFFSILFCFSRFYFFARFIYKFRIW